MRGRFSDWKAEISVSIAWTPKFPKLNLHFSVWNRTTNLFSQRTWSPKLWSEGTGNQNERADPKRNDGKWAIIALTLRRSQQFWGNEDRGPELETGAECDEVGLDQYYAWKKLG